MGTDVLLLVPFEPTSGMVLDAQARRTIGAELHLPLMEARLELEEYLGQPLEGAELGEALARPVHRSLSAVALATNLERAGLAWQVLDPGRIELGEWRKLLAQAKRREPLTVAICTTFVSRGPWLRAFFAMVRKALPGRKLLVGGYYYATSAREFLSLDADVFCIGEGERRLPAIVKAIKAGDPAALEAIRGLYLRDSNGDLRHTGRSEPLDLETLPPPDWRLSARIDPPADLERDELASYVETQRGCFFKCEFCTYRTLAELTAMSPSRSLEHINAAAATPKGSIYIVDATATYTKKRWKQILDLLIARGGSPLPLLACARVADIDDAIGAAMARAGVRWVIIGQESGDQGMLNRMKKGTKVSHVKPTVAALGKNGVDVLFSFFHGFPGETQDSIEATRSMIASLNEGFEQRPVCAVYSLETFTVQDLATVSSRTEALEFSHPLGYRTREFTSEEVAREVLRTLVAVSKVSGAPVYVDVVRWVGFPRGSPVFIGQGPSRAELLHWLKAVERGIMIFVEKNLEGTKPDPAELRRLKDLILTRYPRRYSPVERMTAAARSRARRYATRKLRIEWKNEADSGMGPATRGLVGWTVLRSTLELGPVYRAMIGREPAPETPTRVIEDAAPLAEQLIKVALSTKPRFQPPEPAG